MLKTITQLNRKYGIDSPPCRYPYNQNKTFIYAARAYTKLVLQFSLVLFFTVLVSTSTAFAQRYVNVATGADVGNCADPTAPCQTINYAIGQATPTETVNIAVGLYPEEVFLNKALTLQGAGSGDNPTTSTIINPPAGSLSAIDITAANSSVFDVRATGADYGVRLQAANVNNIILNGVAAIDNASYGIIIGNVTNMDNITIENTEVRNNGYIGISLSATVLNALNNITIRNTALSANGDGAIGSGDINFFLFNGNAILENVSITNGTGHIGLQIRGWDNQNPNPLLRLASFQPAGNVTLNNVSVQGSYKRSSDAAIPGGCLYVSGYSAGLDNISFNDVELISTGIADGFSRTGLYLSEIIVPQVLDVGNTVFRIAGAPPAFGTVVNSFIINQTQVGNINATDAAFNFLGALQNKTVVENAFLIENFIAHGIDAHYVVEDLPLLPFGGFVEVRSGYAYITLNAFLPGITAEPHIQRAVECADNGFIVYIERNGTNAFGTPYPIYELPVSVYKTLDFQSNSTAYTQTSIREVQMNDAAATLTFDGNFGIIELLDMQEGDVVVNAGQDVALRSTPIQTAMVINADPTNTVQGNVIMERYVPTSTDVFPGAYDGPGGYHMCGSPFLNATNNQFASAMSLILNTAFNANPEPATTVPFPTFYEYIEPTAGIPSPAGIYNGFLMGFKVPEAGLGGLLVPGRGYQANMSIGNTVILNGNLNNGAQAAVPITNSGISATMSGFNLVGNPYPSPILWSQVRALSTNVADAIYIDIATSRYGGTYASYVNGVGTNGGDNEIASMQGFFVYCPTATGQIVMDNSVRPTTYSNRRFFREPRSLKEGIIKIQIKHQELGDEMAVYFENGATASFDAAYDAFKIRLPDSQNPAIYTYTAEDEQESYSLSISGLPSISEATVIPIAIDCKVSGEHSIQLAEEKYLHNLFEIYLYDSLTQNWQDLRKQPIYTFEATKGLEINRFSLHFKGPDNNDFYGENALVAYPNPTQGEFALSFKSNEKGKHNVGIYDTAGRLLKSYTFDKAQAFLQEKLDISELPTGIYILKVSGSNNKAATKIVKP
ncbi:MAG: T9SS type A sorting domain-containing protein [Bernardetiaceae bacterium]|nr:T9SS type A sorting domain-containing protein [Bernardetiaceae bacterium]